MENNHPLKLWKPKNNRARQLVATASLSTDNQRYNRQSGLIQTGFQRAPVRPESLDVATADTASWQANTQGWAGPVHEIISAEDACDIEHETGDTIYDNQIAGKAGPKDFSHVIRPRLKMAKMPAR